MPHLDEDAGGTVAVLCNAAADEVFHHTLPRIETFTNVFGELVHCTWAQKQRL